MAQLENPSAVTILQGCLCPIPTGTLHCVVSLVKSTCTVCVGLQQTCPVWGGRRMPLLAGQGIFAFQAVLWCWLSTNSCSHPGNSSLALIRQQVPVSVLRLLSSMKELAQSGWTSQLLFSPRAPRHACLISAINWY